MAEFNLYIPSLLDISPSILDNVVFCHQEESNWPFYEVFSLFFHSKVQGMELKKKFDAIFENTKYLDIIKEIKDIIKEKVWTSKEEKSE